MHKKSWVRALGKTMFIWDRALARVQFTRLQAYIHGPEKSMQPNCTAADKIKILINILII